MEFVKRSSAVTEVLIPEGDVIRITDKSTGNVLWEKTHRWIKIKNAAGCERIFDRGDDIFFYFGSGVYSTYNPKTWDRIENNIYASTTRTSVNAVDMDTVSKTLYESVWVYDVEEAVNESRISINYGLKAKLDDGLNVHAQRCCWIPELDKFCLLANREKSPDAIYAYLVNKSGRVTNTGILEGCAFDLMDDWHNRRGLVYSSELNKFIAAPTQIGMLLISSDGVSWTKKQIFTNTQEIVGLYWISELNLFFAIVSEKNTPQVYIYKSEDGDSWIKVCDYPAEISENQSFRGSTLQMSYSPKKRIFLFTAFQQQNGSCLTFLTKDFVSWEEFELTLKQTVTHDLIWSPSTGAFLLSTNNSTYKLYP